MKSHHTNRRRFRAILISFALLLCAALSLRLLHPKPPGPELSARNPTGAPATATRLEGVNVLPPGTNALPSAASLPLPTAGGNGILPPPPDDVGGISASAMREITAIESAKARRPAVQDKIDSQLLYADSMRRGVPIAEGVPTQRVSLDYDPQGRVLVDITAVVTPELLQSVAAAGGNVINDFPQYHAIRAAVPLARVEAIAGRAGVQFIQPAVRSVPSKVDSQGDVTHQASVARPAFGADGTGVKVGVLSDSVDNLSNSQVAGLVTVLPGQSGVRATGEGTAMLELVNDLAPGAQLFFATADPSEASFASNILSLRNAGCDIIIDDVGYFDESPFQDGIVAQAVNTVTAGGALYFASAGNNGNEDSGTSGTWEGDFVDGGPTASPVEAGRVHAFASGTNYVTVLPGGYPYIVDLFWSDPLGASTNDYDVFVLNAAGTSVLASSTTRQNGTQNPYEYIGSLNSNERIVVVKYSGTNRFLYLDTYGGLLNFSTGGATRGHASATNAFCVAAVSALNTYPNPFTGGPGDPVETYSSDGPRQVFYQANGTPITPGNFSSSGGAVRQKPDIAAADHVSTDLASFNPFSGTSAAAPHAGAIAALLKSYNPTLTPSQIRSYLTGSALDIMGSGVDRDSGYGIVMAPAALQSAPPEPLLIQPQTGFAAVGYAGGPFAPSSQVYSLTNVGTGPLTWSLANPPAWLTASVQGGSLTPGGPTTAVTISLNSAASNLPPGLYTTNLFFTNVTSGVVRTRTLSLTVNEALQISPATGFTSIGGIGGPFSVTSQVITLTNAGSIPVSWALSNNATWLAVSSPGGTLLGGQSIPVTVSLNSVASNLPPASYTNTLSFIDLADAGVQSVPFVLTVYQWTPITAPTPAWQTVASSADGSRWIVGAINGGLYIFTNFGSNWFQATAPSGWLGVASSADASKLVAVSSGYIYTSADSGQTWVSNNLPAEQWENVASSADGTKLVAAANFNTAGTSPGFVYGSTNAGGFWTNIGPSSTHWGSVASSADGTRLVAGVLGGLIYASTNAGKTWTNADAPSGYWQSIAASADGTKWIAADYNYSVYTSTNSGLHWIPRSPPGGSWAGVASSADGTKLVAVTRGAIYSSTDSGNSWLLNSAPNQPWTSVASSADGNKRVVVASDGVIYVSTLNSSLSPPLSISVATNQFVISWPAADSGFSLQQSSNLAATNWVTLSNAVNVVNGTNQVIIVPSNQQSFYRLINP